MLECCAFSSCYHFAVELDGEGFILSSLSPGMSMFETSVLHFHSRFCLSKIPCYRPGMFSRSKTGRAQAKESPAILCIV